ncbi:hypothetical protein ACFX2J_028250 [Malus domestica]
MASSKAQAVPVTNAKNKSILVAGGVTSGIIIEARQELFLPPLPPLYQLYREIRAPEARTCDHPGLAKGANGGKPKEVLWFHAFRCRLKRQFIHASHDHWSDFHR